MKALTQGVKRFMRDEEGVTMVEYGLIAALIAIVCIAAITVVGTQLNATFTTVGNALTTANG